MQKIYLLSYSSSESYCNHCSKETVVNYRVFNSLPEATELADAFRTISRFIFDNTPEFNMYSEDCVQMNRSNYGLDNYPLFEKWWQDRFKELESQYEFAIKHFEELCKRYKGSYYCVNIPTDWEVSEFDNNGYKK